MLTIKWVLAMMIATQPEAPWRATYEATAEAIVAEASSRPLPFPKDAEERTAALLVSTAWFESTFKPDAEGDHDKLPDGRKGTPRSFCLFQIGSSNFAALGVTREQILTDVPTCVRAAGAMMRVSFSVCRGRPAEELLGHYASGGASCAGVRESRHRWRKGAWLFAHVPGRQ